MMYRCLSCDFKSNNDDQLFWVREFKTAKNVLIVLCEVCIKKDGLRKVCDGFTIGVHV